MCLTHHASVRSTQTRRSAHVSVENVGHERLEAQTTTSIPEQILLRAFKGVTEGATFETSEDSDGEIGPFLDDVAHEASVDELHDEQPTLSLESASSNTVNVLPPPSFTNEELKK